MPEVSRNPSLEGAAPNASPVVLQAVGDQYSYGVQDQLEKLRLQKWVDTLFLFPFSLLFKTGLYFWGGYRIQNLKAVRKQYREVVSDPSPLIICANHLTYIDSALILAALAPVSWYAINPKKYSWNLPAGDHFKKKFIHRMVAFFAKCIYIHRDGSKEHKSAVLNTARYLVSQGEVLTIFPEGSRSRSGRVDPEKMTSGVGRLLYHLKNPRVLCIYLRGDRQETFSNYPARGSRFYFKMEAIRPETKLPGKEGYVELTRQVALKLKALEDEYFAGRNGR